MRLATVGQSKEIDEVSQKDYSLTGETLMESAGALAAREVIQSFFPELSRGTLSIICGPGNNGGDGLVLARHMHSAGFRNTVVYLLGEADQRSDLFKLQHQRADLQGVRIIVLDGDIEKLKPILESELVIDALFGIGLSRKVEGIFQQATDLINSSKCPVVSVDLPTGLDADSGQILGAVVKANMTLSFGLAKPGFFVLHGPESVGRLRVLPIGFPFEALRTVATTHFLFNEKLARRYLKARKDLTNKSDHGHLLVAAGSEGHWGAGVLASASAFRMGVGYVTWASVEEPSQQIQEIPDVMTTALKDWQEGKDPTAIAIGPGLGVNQQTADLIKQLLKDKYPSVVLDADAMHACKEFDLFPLPSSWVLTPHSGELGKLLGEDPKEIEKDRFKFALEASEKFGCHVLLKGYRTVIASEGRCMVIHSGNSSLAKAGTGDVLTGMIGALMAQGMDTLQAAATGAYIHGRIADEWVRAGNDKNSLMASDLTEHLPQLMGRISAGSLV